MIIQPLRQEDIIEVAGLQPPDWKNIIPVHEMYLSSDFCFPFKVVDDDKLIGIGTTIIHFDTAWLAHIIVNPDHRNKGTGRLITQTLMDNAHSHGCNSLYLIATDLGAPVYEKLGFITETEYLFFKNIQAEQSQLISTNIIPYSSVFQESLFHLDRKISGEDRQPFIQQYLENGFIYLNDKTVEGFYLADCGEGIILAITTAAGIELSKLRLTSRDHSVFPIENVAAASFYEQKGYKPTRTAKRMRFGKERRWHPENMYNRTGGNFG